MVRPELMLVQDELHLQPFGHQTTTELLPTVPQLLLFTDSHNFFDRAWALWVVV